VRRPPELLPVFVAAAGALALAVGLVALLNGRLVGAVLAVGGAAIVVWSIVRVRG
jgi:hypothetical protein